VTIQLAPIERPFQVTLPVPLQLDDIAPGLLGSINPQIVSVTLSGTAARLSSLDTSTLVGRVSARGYAAGVYSVEPTFALPQGISRVGDPPKVTLSLRAPPTAQPEPSETAAPDATAPGEAPPAATPAEATPQATAPPAEPTLQPSATPGG
jgi:hypothetical protein